MNSNVGISEVFCFVFSKKYRCRRLSVRYLPVIVYLFSGKPPEIPGYHTREHSPGGQPENTRRAQYRGEQGNHARGTPGEYSIGENREITPGEHPGIPGDIFLDSPGKVWYHISCSKNSSFAFEPHEHS